MQLTIGIPFLDPGPAFEKAVRSVFAQSFADWELILLDDGSTDGSLERAREIRDRRVTVVSDGGNQGLCGRLNQIAELARGDLLCRMDADDVMHPERLRRQVDWLERHPELDVVGARAVALDEHDRPMCLLGQAFAPEDVERVALIRSLFVHPAVMGRTCWFRENPYDPAYPRSEDHELWLRAAPRSRYAMLEDALLFYRQPRTLNLRGYVATCRTDRKIVRTYGPRGGRRALTIALLARSYAFEAVHRLAAAAGAAGPLMRLRGPGLPAAARDAAAAALRQALRAEVPGWSASPDAGVG
jgi:glycosyltransferase involved in cell wall biosynthesis